MLLRTEYPREVGQVAAIVGRLDLPRQIVADPGAFRLLDFKDGTRTAGDEWGPKRAVALRSSGLQAGVSSREPYGPQNAGLETSATKEGERRRPFVALASRSAGACAACQAGVSCCEP